MATCFNVSRDNYIQISLVVGLSEQQNNSNSTSTYSAPTLFPEKPTESNVTCPLVYSYKIYETVDKKVDQIAIEHINFSSVDVYEWSPRYKSVKYESYSSKCFAAKHVNTSFKYIGDTTAGKPIVMLSNTYYL